MILLVEDDEDVRDMLALTLRMNGFEVELAENGSAALVALERRPCLMILDLVMPRLGGRGVLAEMKLRGRNEVPVCVISALDGPPPDGVVAALRKPFETAELVEIAARYCSCRVGAAPASP